MCIYLFIAPGGAFNEFARRLALFCFGGAAAPYRDAVLLDKHSPDLRRQCT
jgi:hypothetical protein